MKSKIQELPNYHANKNIIELWLRDFFDDLSEYSFPRDELEDSMFPARRVRPLLFLTLLDNHKGKNGFTNLIKQLCLSLEIAHRASLIVDDQVDNDLMRRGAKTFHAKWGSDEAILFSHQLMSLALISINELDSQYSLRFAKTYSSMCIGQRADLGNINFNNLSYIGVYKKYVLLKTSSIYKLIFEYAALIQKLDNNFIDLYGAIGESFGRLYQMYNDYFDDSCDNINARGEKNYYDCNLSLFPAIVAEYGSSFAKKKIIKAMQSSKVNKDDFRKIKNLYSNNMILHKANLIVLEEEHNFNFLLKKIDNKKVRVATNIILSFIRERTCWDQKNIAASGY